MKNLKSLGLNKTKISDAGMPWLAELTKLHDLGLDGTQITDKGMAALQGMTDLVNLYVGMTDVTAQGLAMVPRKERMQVIVVFGGETAVETGRAVGTKKDLNEPVWDVLYTATWVRKDGKWWVVNEHQSRAR
jgi:hypothetical protein